MRLIGNVIWLLFTGLITFFAWLLMGVLWCITLIGIPFGLQCFKIAVLTLWPFGKTVNTRFSVHPIANLIWMLLFGWELFLGYALAGVLYYITIVGIPFGMQCFKLAQLSLCPFGSDAF